METVKDLIKLLLKKWSCCHEWTRECVIESETSITIVFRCTKCGKLKRIKNK